MFIASLVLFLLCICLNKGFSPFISFPPSSRWMKDATRFYNFSEAIIIAPIVPEVGCIEDSRAILTAN